VGGGGPPPGTLNGHPAAAHTQVVHYCEIADRGAEHFGSNTPLCGWATPWIVPASCMIANCCVKQVIRGSSTGPGSNDHNSSMHVASKANKRAAHTSPCTRGRASLPAGLDRRCMHGASCIYAACTLTTRCLGGTQGALIRRCQFQQTGGSSLAGRTFRPPSCSSCQRGSCNWAAPSHGQCRSTAHVMLACL
jgi:hypothetical protein